MKTTIHTRLFRALLMAVLMAVAALPAGAVIVDGLVYDINNDSNSVTLTYMSYEYPSYPDLEGHISIPSSVEWQGKTYAVTKIDDWTFALCDKITSVEIPNTVTSLGEGVFYGCSALSFVKISGPINLLDKYVFCGCHNLKGLYLPSSLKGIYYNAFEECNNLRLLICKVMYPSEIVFGNNYNFNDIDKEECSLIIPKGTLEAYQQTQPWSNFKKITEMDFGDINLDGDVTASDITSLYNYLLIGDDNLMLTGDINCDGSITSADITMLYSIMLEGSNISYPFITLEGDKTVLVGIGDNYVEPGYSAEVNGEDITNSVIVTSNVDTSKPGFYTVTYSVERPYGLKDLKTRNVWVNNPGHFNNIYWGECWHSTNSQSHYYNSPIVIEETDSSEYLYTINDVLGGFYSYGKYPGYILFHCDFFVDALLKLDGASVTMLEENEDWYFYDSEDLLEMLDGQWNPETGVVTYRMNYHSSGGVVLTPIDETNINGVVYDNNSSQE